MTRPPAAAVPERRPPRPQRQRGSSSLTGTPRLGTGQQLDPEQLRAIERCALKVPYTCRAVAETACIALGWAGVDVEPRRCEVCDLWHVTHRRSA